MTSPAPSIAAGAGPVPVPNLVIMGAQKSGTTSLHKALARHPDIHMSRPLKEATYFYPDDLLFRRLAQYGFAGIDSRDRLVTDQMLRNYRGQKVFGESPTDYTVSDRARSYGIPERMARMQPDLRFIYIVRHPFDRMLSARRHIIGTTGRDPFAEIIAGDAGPLDFFLLTSLYGYQLSAYLAHFPRDRFHILAFEDFAADQTAELHRVHAFLGLRTQPQVKEFFNNESGDATWAAPPRLPRAILDRVHARVVADMAEFRRISGFDTSRWDLDFDTWCADD